jgi:hypothetical protein
MVDVICSVAGWPDWRDRAAHSADECRPAVCRPIANGRGEGGRGGQTKSSINPMQCLKPVISLFFAHLGSMTEADGAVPWLRK